MTIMLGCSLASRGASHDPTATVEARTICRGVADHGAIDVGVAYHDRVHMHHRCVVAEMAAFPPPADKAHSEVSETVIHATVESNMRTPIARMP